MRRQRKICNICGREISCSNYNRHLKSHETSPEYHRKVLNRVSLTHDDLVCQYCKKECKNKNSLIQHEIRCKENPNRLKNICKGNKISHVAWNKGLTSKSDSRILKGIETYKTNHSLGLHLDTHGDNNIVRKNPSIREKIRITAINNIKSGRVTPICHSKAKHGYYMGIYCDSLWELCYIIYAKDNGINIVRNKKSFTYIYNNQEHLYFPDFYNLDTNTYIEIKGYKDKKAKSKQEQFPLELEVLEKSQMLPIIEYVKNTYTDDLESLYDKPPIA